MDEFGLGDDFGCGFFFVVNEDDWIGEGVGVDSNYFVGFFCLYRLCVDKWIFSIYNGLYESCLFSGVNFFLFNFVLFEGIIDCCRE